MEDFYKSYANQIFNQYRLYANFPPQRIVTIGDIGTLEGKFYKREDSIENVVGLDFKIRSGGSRPNIESHMNLSTSKETKMNLMAKGEAGLVNAGLKVELKDKNSFYLNLAGVTIDEIEDQITLGTKILQLYKEGIWKKDWVVVTSVIKTRSSLILGSLTGNSSIVLESQIDIPSVRLDDASLKLKIKDKVAVEMDIVETNLTPLLELAQVKRKRLFDGPSFGFSKTTEVEDEKLLDIIRLKNRDMADYFELVNIEE